MDYTDFIVKQQGRDLTLLDSSKIVINKYDNKVTRIVFEFDETIPGRYYFAMKNPVTGKYRILPIINNHMVIGTSISSYPGTWVSILIVVDEHSEIVNDDIDETQFTFVSNPFSRIVVRNNFLNEEDIEEENEEIFPIINEILDNLVKAQDRLENAAITASEAAARAEADREIVEELMKDINKTNDSIAALERYIEYITNARDEVLFSKEEIDKNVSHVNGVLTEVKKNLTTIEITATHVLEYKESIEKTVNDCVDYVESNKQMLLDAYNQYIQDIKDEANDALDAIQTESELQQELIVAKGQEVLDSIPDDFEDLTDISGKADAIVCTTEGTNIVVNDSSDNKVENLRVFGKSEQFSTTGAQLLDFSSAPIKTVTTEGITVTTTGEGYYTFVGTSTAYAINVWFMGGWNSDKVLFTLPAGTYYIHGVALVNGTTALNTNLPAGNAGNIVTFENDVNVTGVRATFAQIGTYYNEKIYPIIAKSNTPVSYEPYTGGVASPSPNYPQEITSVGDDGNIDVGIYGKNLAKFANEKNSNASAFNYTSETNDNIIASKLETGGKFFARFEAELKKDVTYTIHAKENVIAYVYENDLWGSSVAASKLPFEFNPPKDGIYVIGTYTDGDVGVTVTLTNFQIEEGTNKTEYEPYHKQALTISTPNGFPGIKVTNSTFANYTDADGNMWVADEIDFERGVYIQRIYKQNLPVDGTVIKSSITNRFLIQTKHLEYTPLLQESSVGSILSDKFLGSTDQSKGNNTIAVAANGYISIGYDDSKTVQEFINEFKDNPIKIYYILETPIETPLSSEELETYKALTMNHPTTTVLNDENAHMELTYIADTKTYIDNNSSDISTETLSSVINSYLSKNPIKETDPTVPSWAKQATKPIYTASEVGADPSGTATSTVSNHNVSTEAHNDIRILLTELSAKVTNLLNSDDETLDQTKEIVDYIKANRGLIESVTTEKVNVTDIINNLTTNLSNKVLAASQGVVLKQLIDALQTTVNNLPSSIETNIKKYVDELMTNQTGVQIITWEADD